MDISRVRALRGPNVWSRHTAIEAVVRFDETERSIDRLDGFEARLRAALPALAPLRDDAGAPLGLPAVLARVALTLQAEAGCAVRFVREAPTREAGVTRIVLEYTQEAVGRLAFECATALVDAARAGTPYDAAAAIAKLHELDEDVRLGPSTGAIVQAAVSRGIPFRRLTDGSLVQFGWGVHQRRIQAAEVDATSAIAESIAQDKELTKQLLESIGVPVPGGGSVDEIEDAWAIMQSLGAPAVVKPRDGSQGRGVTVDVETREQLEAAWAAAYDISSDVIVERYIPGDDWRLLVVDGRLVAAARRDPPMVIGDGRSTVRELVEAVNRDPRRGDGHATALTRIRLDAIALARLASQGLDADSVPEAGRKVVLRNNANLSTGGSATDVTDEVHPEVAARAVEAAKMIGLHICGVDVVARSIAEPLEAQGGGIVEVNAAPGLRMHLAPSYGRPRPLGEAIVSTLYPEGRDGRIPTVSVTGTNGKTTTVRLIAHLLASRGLKVGMTNTDGVYVDGVQTDSGDCSGPKSARNVLMHPDVGAAVFETARGGILREGLGFDRCKVGVVTNIGAGDHLGLNHIETPEEVAWVKGVVVENVSPDGMAVLNGEDPLCAAMADRCPGSVTMFGFDASHPVLESHRARGHRIVFRRGADIVAAHREREWRIPLSGVPLAHGGAVGFQVANAMAAIAAVWALDMDWESIRRGLATFVSDAGTVPGRFNVFSWRGATIVADYGHNPDAMHALVQAVSTMQARTRSVVISGAGDRRDEDLRAQTRILGAAFDEVILYQDAAQRGRADGEVVGLLREGLEGAARTRRVDAIHGEFVAIDAALERLGEGDLCLVLVDQVREALDHIAMRIGVR
ncbi:MAG: cyanophycin synthetase [Burkholderiaceae bacterium]|nr:cyanophycin synthetase [Burkholderiales bacterium]MCZ8096536.1 cyanophycin synthetase [Burkholderiales bacterium]MCZ8338611.1 cyanophycin synthetase [Burkholderiaceae bacterium]